MTLRFDNVCLICNILEGYDYLIHLLYFNSLFRCKWPQSQRASNFMYQGRKQQISFVLNNAGSQTL